MTTTTGLDIPVPGTGGATVEIGSAARLLTGGIGDTLSTITGTLAFPGTWKRIGLGALGLYICYIGIVLILTQTTAVKNVLGTAVGAATKGVIKP